MARLKQNERDVLQCMIAGLLIDCDKNLYALRALNKDTKMPELANRQNAELDNFADYIQGLIEKIEGRNES